MQRLVANCCYQFNNKHGNDYQGIVNHGSTTIYPFWLYAVSAGVLHDSFACPKLLSVPISSVISLFVNSSTYASESGGGTQTQRQPQITQMQPQITQAMKIATEQQP